MDRPKRKKVPTYKQIMSISDRPRRGRGRGRGRGESLSSAPPNPYIQAVAPTLNLQPVSVRDDLMMQSSHVSMETLPTFDEENFDMFGIGIDFSSSPVVEVPNLELSGLAVVEVPNLELSGGVQNLENFSVDFDTEVGSSSQRSTGGFFDFDPEKMEKMLSYTENPSKRSDMWARNRFDAWRKFCGLDTSITIEKLPLQEFGSMLCRFFIMLNKESGEHYPTGTIMNMLQAFNRILCHAQDERIVTTGIQEVPFNIKTHPWFKATTRAVQDAMERSREGGANKPRKKVDCITFDEECKVLSHPNHLVTHPLGVQKRFAYYCVTVFLVRGGSELQGLLVSDFELGKDEGGKDCLRYDERLSKNYKVSLKRFQQEHFRSAVVSYNRDVLETFRTLIQHMPPHSKTSGPVFLSCIHNTRTPIWFKQNSLVGLSTMRGWLKQMMVTAGIEGNFSNKSGRVTAITRMSTAQVPKEIMSSITGHRNEKTLARYDYSTLVKQKAAQALTREPYNVITGEPLTFEYYYQKELDAWHAQQFLKSTPRTLVSEATSELKRLTIEDIPVTASHDQEDPAVSFDGDEFWENIDPEKLNRITEASIKSKKFKDEWRRKQESTASTSESIGGHETNPGAPPRRESVTIPEVEELIQKSILRGGSFTNCVFHLHIGEK